MSLVALSLLTGRPVMQSLLSYIHHSLSANHAAFALRVFVSYDALGRRKDSLVVDIEQPRPSHQTRPPLHHSPDLADSAIPRTPSLLVVENKRKDKFPLDSGSTFIQISKSHLPTQCPTSEFGLDWFGMW